VALPRGVYDAFETVARARLALRRVRLFAFCETITRVNFQRRAKQDWHGTPLDWASVGLETLEDLAPYLIRVGRLLAKAFGVGVCEWLPAAVEHSLASLIGIRRAPHLPGTSSKRPGIV
jgi:hypothetical protein